MSIEETLADIPYEGEMETETPADSPTEEQPVVEESQTPSQEGEPGEPEDNTPDEDYSKKTSKRIESLLAERAQERERANELEQRLAQLEARGQTEEEVVIPERFVKLYGDDPETYREWKAMQEEEKASWIEEAHAKWEEKQSAAQREAEEFAQSYEKQIGELEASTGKTIDHNELQRFMLEDMPGGPSFLQDGTPNWAAALAVMEASKPKQDTSARKTIASPGKTGGDGSKGWATPEDFIGFGGR